MYKKYNEQAAKLKSLNKHFKINKNQVPKQNW